MKINSTNPRALSRLMLLGLVLYGITAAGQARAALVTQAAQGDVILAFRNRAVSATSSYLVNVGPASQFVSASPGSTTPLASVGALGSDLQVYNGTDENDNVIQWHSSSDVVWSAFSRNTSDNYALFISRPRPSIAVKSNSYAARDGYAHNSAFGQVGSVITQGYNVLNATAGNPRGGYQANLLGDASKYFTQVSSEGKLDFGTWSDVEKDFGAGATASAIDLYVHRPAAAIFNSGTVTYLGYFSISTAGVVSFTAPAGVDPFTIDSDKDGFSDGDETLAGTNPLNPASFFRLPAPVVVPGTSATFNLATIANRKYTIQYNFNLAGPWQDVHVHLSGGGAAPLNFIDTTPARISQPRGFYRAFVGNP
ncbi:MAG: hypothetical protein H7Y36_03625 [Armatimonadetes bacterium]|nr:hypothetical protein [Akkermansiaceae bacterium]